MKRHRVQCLTRRSIKRNFWWISSCVEWSAIYFLFHSTIWRKNSLSLNLTQYDCSYPRIFINGVSSVAFEVEWTFIIRCVYLDFVWLSKCQLRLFKGGSQLVLENSCPNWTFKQRRFNTSLLLCELLWAKIYIWILINNQKIWCNWKRHFSKIGTWRKVKFFTFLTNWHIFLF